MRAIDDFSEYLVNAAFGASEKVVLKGLDQVVMYTRAWLSAVGEDRSVKVRADTGTERLECCTSSGP